MVAVAFRQPAGFPGAVSRMEIATIEPQYVDSTAALTNPLAFGKPMKTSSAGNMQALVANDNVSLATGILVRSYPAGASTDPLGTSTAPTSGLCNRLKRGYISILLSEGTAIKDGPVYFRTVAATGPTRPVGNYAAAADYTAVGAAGGGNTGNGTIGTLSAVPPALGGVYNITFTAATKFTVSDPNGNQLLAGSTGVAYTDEGVTFTITAGGTAFVAGDTFTVTVVQRTAVLPGAFFMGPADANGNTEMAYNI